MQELSAALIGTLETSLNALLSTRPIARERLSKLAGKRVSIEVLPSAQTVHLLFTENSVLIFANSDAPADARIRGNLSDLLKLVYEPRSVLFGQGIEIEGDASLMQRIQSALIDSELDWETWLSSQIGDLSASAVLQGQESVKSWFIKSKHAFSQSLKDYLQDEIKLLPTRTEYEEWNKQLETLSNRIDNLNQRSEKLGSKRLNDNQNQDRHENE